MNAVESEFTHFRELYFSTTYRSWANNHNFISSLSSQKYASIIKLGKYLKEAFELRDQSI